MMGWMAEDEHSSVEPLEPYHWFHGKSSRSILLNGIFTRSQALELGVWITADSRELLLIEMGDDHLIATIKYCQDNLGRVPKPLTDEQERRKCS